MGIRKRLFSTLFTLTVGAVAGLLLAKKPGEELKQELKEKGEQVRKDVAKKLMQVGDISRTAYEEVVAEVIGYYEKAGSLTKAEADVLKKDLTSHWKEIVTVLQESEGRGEKRTESHKKRRKH